MALPDKFLKPYDNKAVEGSIYKRWEDSGFFNPDSLAALGAEERGTDAESRGKKPRFTEPYTIIMPPPNANGSLHVGHALFVTLQDLLVRYKRMRGYKTLWLPGADHAGFETQLVYEKKLEKEGRSRFKMDRDEFYKETLAFTEANRKFMEGQLRQLGASCDWSREKFTLDPDIVQTVYGTFKKLHEDGLIYRGVRPVNWSTKYQTSLSDLETKTVERKDPLYYLKYGPFVLATVRPETKFGDTAVAVNPNDTRYAAWVGKEIEFESLIGPVKLKVIADEYVDMEFGTGVVKITPAHDPNDFEVAQRHNLPAVEVIDRYGRLTEKCGKYAGMKVMEARAAVAKDLAEKGLLEKVDENYTHNVVVNYKNENDILEPRIMPQWYITMQPLASLASDAVKDGRVKFVTDYHEKIFFHWLENLRDWNISRQIVWGIPIPAWFCGEKTQTTKRMGFAGDIVSQVFDAKTVTYRSRDHGLSVGETVAFEDSVKKTIFGYGTITEVKKMTVKDIDLQDSRHWKTYEKQEDLIAALKRHHPEKDITNTSPVWVYTYTFSNKFPVDGCGTITISTERPGSCPACGNHTALIQDPDTFDTWFSSGQWPFATLGYPDHKDFKTFYPTAVMETGYDILFFWVMRMIMLGLYRTGEVPFKHVYLHGLVRDAQKQKMSKSKGNVINPLEVTETYGTDALRMALLVGNTPGQDMALAESKIKSYKLFANKLWNIARFVLENCSDAELTRNDAELTPKDIELRAEFDALAKDVTLDLDEYRLYMAADKLYHYVWDRFASALIEESKPILKGADAAAKASRQTLLVGILRDSLKLLHPFMPFVTEEIWGSMPGAAGLLMVEEWPLH